MDPEHQFRDVDAEGNAVESRELLVTVGEKEEELELHIYATTFNGEQGLRLELSSFTDVLFLLYCDLQKEAYQQIVEPQKLSIPFESFTADFFAILDKVQDNSELYGGLFSLQIVLQGDEENKALSIIQKSNFLTLPLISLPFRSATNEETTDHLVSIIQNYQNGTRNEEMIRTTFQFNAKLNEKTAETKEQYEQQMKEMKETLEKQIESLKQELATIDEQHNSTLAEQNAQWQKKLEDIQAQFTESQNQLLALQGERDQLTATVSTLKEKVAIVENVEALQEESKKQSETIQQMESAAEQQKNTIEMQKKELSENEETMKSLAVQLSELRQKCSEQEESMRNLEYANKMKDRAITCLNVEINKMKLGTRYSPA
ncbi:hypothetical protein WA577_005540 [Blastocystis sp. JDR]